MSTSPASVKAVVVMGVSGCGKSSVGVALAKALGGPFLEGDAFHSPANKTKMAAGIALDDADRWPWLDALGTALGIATGENGVAVAACSALKRSYRERLATAARMPLKIVFLDGDAELIAARMRSRTGHYMPISLLQNQLETLERPAPDENALTLSIERDPQALIAQIEAWCST